MLPYAAAIASIRVYLLVAILAEGSRPQQQHCTQPLCVQLWHLSAWTTSAMDCDEVVPPAFRATPGAPRSRLQAFFLQRLGASARASYICALAALSSSLLAANCSWDAMDPVERDWWVAEYILTKFEEGDPAEKTRCQFMLSALRKIDPRSSFPTSWKVVEEWRKDLPCRQAPAAPAHFIVAICVALVALGQPAIGTGLLCCFCGLLRVSEMLGLVFDKFVDTGCAFVCLLGRTKRGIEERVVLQHPSLLRWLRAYVQRYPGKPWERVFPTSYTSVLGWLRKACAALSLAAFELTTHSFRRSGASELSRLGVPLEDLLLFGRWASPRAAKEYIRRGEVAAARVLFDVSAETCERVGLWASAAADVWSVHDTVRQLSADGAVTWKRGAHAAALRALEQALFGCRQ